MRRSLAQTETSSEAVWTVLSRRLADATQLVNCSYKGQRCDYLLSFFKDSDGWFLIS